MKPQLIDPSDGKPRYIVRHGNYFHLSRDKRNGIDYIPQGYEITLRNGHLYLQPPKSND